MDAAGFTRGLRVVGPVFGVRRAVDARLAFDRHCAADAASEPGRESYLSAFRFDRRMDERLSSAGSESGYDGPTWSEWLWFDVDRDDPAAALADARRLAASIIERYRTLDEDALLLFLSGRKGYHVGLPSSLWGAEAGDRFAAACKSMAASLAAAAGVRIDSAIYQPVRLLRAPNSRHPKTGLHKRRLSFDELLHLSDGGIRRLAEVPLPFEVPPAPPPDPVARSDWDVAAANIAPPRHGKPDGIHDQGFPRFTKLTWECLREGLVGKNGERATRLFAAAANLGDFGCPLPLALELLMPLGVKAGLPHAEARRQIERGLQHAARKVPPSG